MKTFITVSMSRRTLGAFTSTMAITMLGGALLANAADIPIIKNTFDPPSPSLEPPGGWENGVVENVSRQYVNQGDDESTALQISATFPGTDYAAVFSGMFQSGAVGGNDWATRENTVISFDLKVDSPGLKQVGVYLDAFAEYFYNYGDIAQATYSGASILVALRPYQPGEFQRVVVRLDDPRWQQVYPWPDTSHFAPFFDPASRTYNNVTLFVDWSCLAVPGSFKLTVANVQIRTKNPMIPFNGTGVFYFPGNGSAVLTGTAGLFGRFKQIAVFPPYWAPGTFELTTENGDTLSGLVNPADTEFGVQILQGTGRFSGAVGSYRGIVGQDPVTGGLTATFTGAISSAGSKQE